MGKSFLPAPGTPLQDSGGMLIHPTTAATFSRVQVPSSTEAVRLVASTRRKLADLPALPKQLNTYSVVLVYTASGLSDEEISAATGFDKEQIAHIRSQPAYAALQEFVVEAAKNDAAEEVKTILRKGVTKAAKRVVELADSEDEKVALAASKDLLDRNGHAPKQQVDIRNEMMSTFRIEVVDKRSDATPMLDLEAEDIS